ERVARGALAGHVRGSEDCDAVVEGTDATRTGELLECSLVARVFGPGPPVARRPQPHVFGFGVDLLTIPHTYRDPTQRGVDDAGDPIEVAANPGPDLAVGTPPDRSGRGRRVDNSDDRVAVSVARDPGEVRHVSAPNRVFGTVHHDAPALLDGREA